MEKFCSQKIAFHKNDKDSELFREETKKKKRKRSRSTSSSSSSSSSSPDRRKRDKKKRKKAKAKKRRKKAKKDRKRAARSSGESGMTLNAVCTLQEGFCVDELSYQSF